MRTRMYLFGTGWEGADVGLGTLFDRAVCGSCFSHTSLTVTLFFSLSKAHRGRPCTIGGIARDASNNIRPWQQHRRVFCVCFASRFHPTQTPPTVFTHFCSHPLSSIRPSTCELAVQRVQYPTVWATCQQRRTGSGVCWWRCSGASWVMCLTISFRH